MNNDSDGRFLPVFMTAPHTGVEKINWIRCTDRMPLDDEKIIIFLQNTDKQYFIARVGSIRESLLMAAEWTPYDEATWHVLNNNIINDGMSEIRPDPVTGVPTIYQAQRYGDLNLDSKKRDKS